MNQDFNKLLSTLKESGASDEVNFTANTTASIPMIVFHQGIFKIKVAGKVVEELARSIDVYIIDAMQEDGRIVYDGKYTGGSKDQSNKILCFSTNSRVAHGSVPDKYYKDGVSYGCPSKTRNCNSCPFSENGSAREFFGVENNAAACQQFRRISVMLADNPDAGLFRMVVKQTSLWGKSDPSSNRYSLQDYLGYWANNKLAPYRAVTKLSPSPDTEARFVFSPIEATAADMVAYIKDPETGVMQISDSLLSFTKEDDRAAQGNLLPALAMPVSSLSHDNSKPAAQASARIVDVEAKDRAKPAQLASDVRPAPKSSHAEPEVVEPEVVEAEIVEVKTAKKAPPRRSASQSAAVEPAKPARPVPGSKPKDDSYDDDLPFVNDPPAATDTTDTTEPAKPAKPIAPAVEVDSEFSVDFDE